MDDELLPASKPQEDDVNESDGEEERPDWSKLIKGRPVIPKRGEKSHEPSGEQGAETNLQMHILQRARTAMFEALRAPRTVSSKAVSYAEWDPCERRAKVTVARGVHFAGLGWKNWLLPEETLYLVERGSMVCTKHGGPMSVQQAYADMIGQDITLEVYQVYSYLKRLGYIVTRFRPAFADYPTPRPYAVLSPGLSILERLKRLLTAVCAPFIPATYASLYRSMRLKPVSIPSPPRPLPTSPYMPIFNLYKPPSNTPFKKSAPSPAPWQVVVINARTTPMPTLTELESLFDIAPPSEIPPPKRPLTPRPLPKFNWLSPRTWWPKPDIPKRNPFVALRAGKKTAVIAVVDTGNVGFFRFMQGAFEEFMHGDEANWFKVVNRSERARLQ